MCLSFGFLANQSFEFFFIGRRFAVNIKDCSFGGLLDEVGVGKFVEFRAYFVFLLLFKEALPGCDEYCFDDVFEGE